MKGEDNKSELKEKKKRKEEEKKKEPKAELVGVCGVVWCRTHYTSVLGSIIYAYCIWVGDR